MKNIFDTLGLVSRDSIHSYASCDLEQNEQYSQTSNKTPLEFE